MSLSAVQLGNTARCLEYCGISYIHFPELGGLTTRTLMRKIQVGEFYLSVDLLTTCRRMNFERGLERLIETARNKNKRIALQPGSFDNSMGSRKRDFHTYPRPEITDEIIKE